MPQYNDKISEYGDVITVQEFRRNVAQGGFIDYDGFGYPMKNGKCDQHLPIYPSEIEKMPKDATHIIWFNR